MNAPQAPIPNAMVDVQNLADTRQIAINRVGIKSIRHPVKVLDKSGGVQHTIAMFNMYVRLPHNFKGTHMSRCVEILKIHEREISVENFPTMLREMLEKLEAETGEDVYKRQNQTYAHKVLTGRRAGMSRLRTHGGVSGFPKRS